MREKIATALRIAVFYEHTNLCIGSFGLGSGFRYVILIVACVRKIPDSLAPTKCCRGVL